MSGAIPARDRCVVPHLLAAGAAAHPGRILAVFDDGTTWTYGQARAQALRTASGLRRLGVGKGDTVLCWLPNGPDIIRCWFAINQLGAIFVPINTAYRGRLLEHVVENSGARVAIVHDALRPRLRDGALETVIAPDSIGGDPADPAVQASPAEPWDPYAIIYTSGTTGPSKGVVSPHLQIWASAVTALDGHFGADDRALVQLPLFHTGGTVWVVAALAYGASFAVVDSFETAAFWEVVRRTGATACTLLGVMATFLIKEPPRPEDRTSPLRFVLLVPLAENAAVFHDRFGCDVATAFNMTEVSCPLVSEPNPPAAGHCGRPRPGVEVRLVDEHDVPVPDGGPGELIVRTELPWAMNAGYWRNPEATATAWRNGWFHTGDAFRVDPDGNYVFVDRLKDALRRRGENISSFEVEVEVQSHPDVREAAVVGVPSRHGEDDVLAVVAPVDGRELRPAELIAHLVPRLPHFMIPRYVRVVAALPKTPTNKIEKHVLRAEGLTSDTWDREAAGIQIRRQRLTTR